MFGIGIPELIVILVILAVPATIAIVVVLLTRHSANRSVKKEGYMFCTKCGTKNDDNAFKCVQCGNVLQHPQQFGTGASEGMAIPNYLAQAILLTILCCLPLGIPAIVFAAQVNGKLAAGDYAGAVETSKKAKMWCWISFWVGLGLWIIWILITVIGGFAGR